MVPWSRASPFPEMRLLFSKLKKVILHPWECVLPLFEEGFHNLKAMGLHVIRSTTNKANFIISLCCILWKYSWCQSLRNHFKTSEFRWTSFMTIKQCGLMINMEDTTTCLHTFAKLFVELTYTDMFVYYYCLDVNTSSVSGRKNILFPFSYKVAVTAESPPTLLWPPKLHIPCVKPLQ